jgi:hypothetical protein
VPRTYGDLRTLIENEQLGWQTPPDVPDDAPLPVIGLGADPSGLISADSSPRVEFTALGPGTNPYLALQRASRGYVTADEVSAAFSAGLLRRLGLDEVTEAIPAAPREAGAPPSSVDWRSRFGQNWITSIRDQNPCNSCWAFAGVALVESMVRIEHAMWTRLSEGDPRDGVGKTCADLGNMGEVSNFFANNGFCDPGSWPWHTDARTYAPTPDRSGRAVRGPAFTSVSVADSKNWLDTVGPLVTYIDVYDDFSGVGTGIYKRSTDPSNAFRGGHLFLIVGYDDALGAWLCKNSWGTWWGMNGFGWIAYGECNIDSYDRSGVQNVNPDPWTKWRLHNGDLYESGNGALHRNLEVAGSNGSRVLHRWREGGPPWTWGTAASFATDAAVCPTLTGTTFNRNLELVYLTSGGRLHHWWTGGGGGGPWNDGGAFGPGGCDGVPGFVQSDYGAPGNFEVVVSNAGQLLHLWRDEAGWHEGPRFGSGILRSGPSLVQGSFGSPHGNLECVAVRNDGTMQHFWRDEPTLTWHAGDVFGASCDSGPVMVQGQYGMTSEGGPVGNFELCVAVGGHVQHWWRWNQGDLQWRHSADFGHDVLAVAGLCESSWGMNLEVIVLRTDQQLQHYWRDGTGWHEGPIIGPA